VRKSKNKLKIVEDVREEVKERGKWRRVGKFGFIVQLIEGPTLCLMECKR
jgi:hypothetical protein